MRNAALDRFGDATDFLIGINGSYARREATEESDVNLFFLVTGNDVSCTVKKQAEFRELLKADLNLKLPASSGVFANPLLVDKICEIGGLTDNNETLTRRMLLLLEGEWVVNEPAFHSARNRLLEKYLYYGPGRDKICMFLLNDIMRYWQTICIDLEHKVYTDNKGTRHPSHQAPLFQDVCSTRLACWRSDRVTVYPARKNWRVCVHSWGRIPSIASRPSSERRRHQCLVSTPNS